MSERAKSTEDRLRNRFGLRNRSGFTLAELLVVVAIIAVLVAVSIPIFASQLEKSRRAADISNARNISAILSACANDGSIEITDPDSIIFIGVSATKIDGGRYSNSGLNDDAALNATILVNGKPYSGISKVWDILVANGFSRDLRMKQKKNGIKWYGVSINGAGQTYYYEGKTDNMNDFRNSASATRYNWSELS